MTETEVIEQTQDNQERPENKRKWTAERKAKWMAARWPGRQKQG